MIKLTASSIAAMPDAAKLSYLWDGAVRGFGIRRTPGGVKSYVFRYRARDLAHRQHILTLGRVDEMRLDAARDAARIMLAGVAQGKNPADPAAVLKAGATVRDLAERYGKEYAPRKKRSSQVNDALLWRRHILPKLGKRPVADLGPADVMQVQTGLMDKPATANRAQALLSRAMALAELWGWRPQNTNPCQQINKFAEKRRQRILNRDELLLLGKGLETIQATRGPGWRYVDLLRLLVLTGCRRDEIRCARWEWINLAEKTINLPTSKTGAKTVYLSDVALAVIFRLAMRRTGVAALPCKGFIFPSGKSARRAITWSHSTWKRMQAAIGLENLRVHDLRHTVGSYAHASGLTQRQVADLLGHKRMETAARYIHGDEFHAGANTAANTIAGLLGQQ